MMINAVRRRIDVGRKAEEEEEEEEEPSSCDTTTRNDTTNNKTNITTSAPKGEQQQDEEEETEITKSPSLLSSSTQTSDEEDDSEEDDDSDNENDSDYDDIDMMRMMMKMIPKPDTSIIGYPVSRYSPDRRIIDSVNTVRSEHQTTKNNNPLGCSVQEWKARTELAAAYRALYLLGLERSSLGSDQASQCIMTKLDGSEHDEEGRSSNSSSNTTTTATKTFLMAEWGMWFEEVTASNLMKLTYEGDIVNPKDGEIQKGSPDRVNTGCVPVAKAIFEAREEDVNTIVHIHPYSVMAVGGLKYGLLPLSQASFFLWGQVSREEYDFTYTSNFEQTLQIGFQYGQRAMLLNHHGMYAVGRDVAEAIFVATHLTQACEVQVQTLSMVGGNVKKLYLPSSEELNSQYKDMMDSSDYSYDGSREWPGIVRKVQRQAPDYNT